MTGVGYFYLYDAMLIKSRVRGRKQLTENVSPRSPEKQKAPEPACFQRHCLHPAASESGDLTSRYSTRPLVSPVSRAPGQLCKAQTIRHPWLPVFSFVQWKVSCYKVFRPFEDSVLFAK